MNHRQWKKVYKKRYGYNPKEVDCKGYIEALKYVAESLPRIMSEACKTLAAGFRRISENLENTANNLYEQGEER